MLIDDAVRVAVDGLVTHGEDDGEVLVVPDELIDLVGVDGILAGDGGAPGVGVDAGAVVVGRLEEFAQVQRREHERALVADGLEHQVGLRGDTGKRAVVAVREPVRAGERAGAERGAGGMGAVADEVAPLAGPAEGVGPVDAAREIG